MSCGEVTHRQKLQDKFLELNPGAAAAIIKRVSMHSRIQLFRCYLMSTVVKGSIIYDEPR